VIHGDTEGDESTLYLWDVRTDQLLKTFTGYEGDFSYVSFSPDGKTLATANGHSSDVKLLDIRTGQTLHTLSGHVSYAYCGGGTITTVRFSPNGEIIATGSEDRTIRLSNVRTGQHLKTLIGHTNAVNSVAFSPDGKTLASGSTDGTILLWVVQ